MHKPLSRETLRLAGMVFWRGGLAFAGVAGVYYGLWQYIRTLHWPWPVKVGATMAAVGVILFMFSLVLERRRDAANEGDLGE